MGYIFIYPAFWIITLIVITILCIKNRKSWFQKNMMLSTLIAIFFCTPFIFSLSFYAVRPASHLSSTGYNPQGGYIEKSEWWDYYNGPRSAEKYWRKKDDGQSTSDDKDFRRDSTWIYFNSKGDTVKTETYKDDKLIRTKTYK